MPSLKSKIKYLFQVTHTLPLLDKINFWVARQKNKRDNQQFLQSNSGFALPPDYYLYETYQLNYRSYKEDGLVSAQEVLDWTKDYLPENKSILEWGCGVARVVRHLPILLGKASHVHGCDINREMIEWDQAHIPDVRFQQTGFLPPTTYTPEQFDLVYGLSVFTHIEGHLQADWVTEIARIVKPGGIFLFTTHGKHYFNKLNERQLRQLQQTGSYTIAYRQQGHRMVTAFNTEKGFRKMLSPLFEVLEYYNGENHMEKCGGQDLWIVRKRS